MSSIWLLSNLRTDLPIGSKINALQHFDSETELNVVSATGIEAICVSSMPVNGIGQQICLPSSAYEPFAIPGLLPNFTEKGCAPPDNPVTPFPGSRSDWVLLLRSLLAALPMKHRSLA